MELTYSDYLKVRDLTNLQELRSDGKEHDEMLFIIIHQSYELWFKQIIHELDSVMNLFQSSYIEERNLSIILNRLDRVAMIQELLISQIKILESMTPMDFLEFRNLLSPASGFQSLQFRVIENKLGLKRENRLRFSKETYDCQLNKKEQNLAIESEKECLFYYLEQWLERTPFIKSENFNFWKEYQSNVSSMN